MMKTTAFQLALLSLLGLYSSVTAEVSAFFGGADHDAYMEWYQSRGSGLFEKSNWMSIPATEDEGVAVHWTVNFQTDEISIAVAARATGWVGFGLSENGGMRGADMILFEAAKPNVLIDAYVLDALVPLVDNCQSWDLNYNQTTDGFLIFEATRRLDTGDSQDRKIQHDDNLSMQPTSIIAAWGDSETYSYHGPNRARSSVRFTDQSDSQVNGLELFHQKMEEESEGWFFVGANEYAVPEVETNYQIFCYNGTHLKEQGVPVDEDLHIIGIEPWIDERARKYVHHFGVAASKSETIISDVGNTCHDGSGGNVPDPEQTLMYTWAAGISQPVFLPQDVSYPMEFLGYGVEIHYDNVDLDAGKVDSSGVRLYWTSKPKKYAAGTMPIADGLNKMQGQSVTLDGKKGLSKHMFTCPSDCSTMTFTGTEPITVYAERFHMHTAGMHATNRVVRNGTVVHSSSVEFWDFDQNGGLLIQQDPFIIQPGDAFETTCYFDSPNEDYQFGGDSEQEMCVVYLYYYPRQTILGTYNSVCNYDFILPACDEQLTSTHLESVDEMERTFGLEPPTCKLPPIPDHSDYYDLESDANSSSAASRSLAITGLVSAFFALLL